MKTPHFIALLLIPVIMAGCYSTSEVDRIPVRMGASGEGKITVAPDEIVLCLGIVKKDQDAEKARAECDKVVGQIKEIVKKRGLDAGAFQTDFIRIKPEYHETNGKTSLDGFVVTKNVVITLHNVDKFDDVFTDAAMAGATHVHKVEFNCTKLDALKEEARNRALADARKKVEWRAEKFGRKVLKVDAITDESSAVANWYVQRGKWG